MRAGTKGVIAATLLAALGLVAGCLESSSLEEAAAAGCETSADCFTGQECTGGACVEAAGGAGGGGGGGGSGPDLGCRTSEDCLAAPNILVEQLYWDGNEGTDEKICGWDPGCLDAACEVPHCVARFDGDRPGGMLCELDDQCSSGRCVESDGLRVCFRACTADTDCPNTLSLAGAMIGLRCGPVSVSDHPYLSCVPATPGEALCRTTPDCAGGPPGATSCRFVGKTTSPLDAVPLCGSPPAGEPRQTGFQCPGGPDSCDGGACIQACQEDPIGAPRHFCIHNPARCSRPCQGTADCPDRLDCMDGRNTERVGSWTSSGQGADPGREVRFCQLPKFGCFEQQDCGGDPLTTSWSQDLTRCKVELAPRAASDPIHLLTRCVAPESRLLVPGLACQTHAECDSGLCAQANGDSPLVGQKVCTVPCDPDPDPDGFPGSGDERDHCNELDFGNDYFVRSRCIPDLVADLPDADGAVVALNRCL